MHTTFTYNWNKWSGKVRAKLLVFLLIIIVFFSFIQQPLLFVFRRVLFVLWTPDDTVHLMQNSSSESYGFLMRFINFLIFEELFS